MPGTCLGSTTRTMKSPKRADVPGFLPKAEEETRAVLVGLPDADWRSVLPMLPDDTPTGGTRLSTWKELAAGIAVGICLMALIFAAGTFLATCIRDSLAQPATASLVRRSHIISPAVAHASPSPAGIWSTLSSSDGLDPRRVAGWEGSMPATGEARVLAIRVSFPASEQSDRAYGFAPGDSAEALQSLIGRHLDGSPSPPAPYSRPYGSLSSYYERSSYGKLSVSGEAYDYAAKWPRWNYEPSPALLFAEAMSALDDEIDYRDYDGNGDGIIDCICIRFAGPETGWGTPWWSHAFHAGGSGPAKLPYGEFDGMLADSLVMLHSPSDALSALSTLIHECGHALGLPDYYRYVAPDDDGRSSGDALGRGIGTFDMMDGNVGDHNGFSKWMLGWVGDEDIVRVSCSPSGLAEVSGGRASSAIVSEDGVAVVALGGFSDDGTGGCGGMAVVYPQGHDGSPDPLSDLLLIQYEPATAGRRGEWAPSGRGFRLFRVRATPSDRGKGLLHDNMSPTESERLIEAVSADSRGGRSLLVEGDEVSLGIASDRAAPNRPVEGDTVSVRVIRSDEGSGTVEIRYARE